MSRTVFELNPVTHITTDAIGQPGQRVFYIQASQDSQVVTLLVEKIQIQSMALIVEQLMQELKERFPNLPNAESDYVEKNMHILPPIDPLFRVGEINLAYDSDRDLTCLIITEIITDEFEPENARSVRFWSTRSQLAALAAWGLDVANHGRPLCPQCGEPMDPEGHFCPKKNGHKH